jgi:hypothetical protein
MSTLAVLLHTAADNLEAECGPANYAIGLTADFQAHLTGLVFQLDVALPGTAYGALGHADLAACQPAHNIDHGLASTPDHLMTP